MNKNTLKKQSLNIVKTVSIIALLSASSTLMASGNHNDEHDSDHGAKKMKSEGHHGSKKEGNDHHGSMMKSGGHHGSMMGDNDHDMSKMNMGSAPAHWMSPKAEAMKKNPVASSSKSIAKGSQLYQTNCAVCHGANAEGDGMAGMMLNPKPANLRAMSGGHPDGDFAFKIREGRGSMPAWKNTLNEKEIWHLVNYIQNLSEPSEKAEGHHAGGHS